MRSRYTAYAVGEVGHLMATVAPEGPHAMEDRASWAADLRAFCASTRFAGLLVHEAGTVGDAGTVRFTARLYQGSRDVSLTETSRFVRRGARWYYVDGVTTLEKP